VFNYENMIELLKEPWPWYIAGPAISLTMLIIGYYGESFGISSSLRTMCAAIGVGKFSDFFNYDWKKEKWNLIFIVGAICGGFIVSTWLSDSTIINLSEKTIIDLENLGVQINEGLIPNNLFSLESVVTLKGFIIMVFGGFLVGFGTRYAGGCTSGHAITGLSNLQLPSLFAVIGFFTGGLIMTHLLLPYILSL